MRRITVRCPDELLGWIEEFGGDEAAALRALATIGAAALGFSGAARPALAEAARRADGRVLALLVELAGGQQPDDSQVTARWLPDSSQTTATWQPQQPGPAGGERTAALDEDDPLAGVGFDV
ncbi:MAG TPA: hypothetical protein VFS21_23630 [Roseiflexaceae bacterium]|nr:hypothetical protein [Roseiflexaceae bacterium]